MQALSIRNNVLIVTGGSRGIGAATSLLAARLGCAVCVNYLRDEPAARAVVESITGAGGRAIAVQADVSVEAHVQRLFKSCDELLGKPTALVNNAGILETQMRVEAMDAGRLERIFRTNVIGAFLCAREAVRAMHASGGEPDRIERLEDQIPMKRGGEADEVAQAILWLLSDNASYVTGSFIDATGGR